MSDRVPSQDPEANAEVFVGRFRSSARGLARAMRSVPGSVVLSFIILIAVAVCVFFSPLIVPNALGQARRELPVIFLEPTKLGVTFSH